MSRLFSAIRPTVTTYVLFAVLLLAALIFNVGACSPICYKYVGLPFPLLTGEVWDLPNIPLWNAFAITADLVIWYLLATLIVKTVRWVRRVIQRRE